MRPNRGSQALPQSALPDRSAVVEVLAATPLFGDLPQQALVSLAAACTVRRVTRGQYLWYQGDDGDRLLIVASGRLKVMVSSEHGDEVVLVTAGRSETIGEIALFDGAPRSASVVAVEPSTVLMLTRSAVIGLLADNPVMLDAVLRGFGQMMRRLTEQMADQIFLDLAGRVAKTLVHFAERRAAGDGDAVLDSGLSQSDLAAMVGASRPAVNRVLQRLAARGLIAIHGKVIVLHDLAGLRDRAGY